MNLHNQSSNGVMKVAVVKLLQWFRNETNISYDIQDEVKILDEALCEKAGMISGNSSIYDPYWCWFPLFVSTCWASIASSASPSARSCYTLAPWRILAIFRNFELARGMHAFFFRQSVATEDIARKLLYLGSPPISWSHIFHVFTRTDLQTVWLCLASFGPVLIFR